MSRRWLYIPLLLAGLLIALLVNSSARTEHFVDGEAVTADELASPAFVRKHAQDIHARTSLDYDVLIPPIASDDPGVVSPVRFSGDLRMPTWVFWGSVVVHPLALCLLFAGFLRALDWMR